MPYIKHFFFLSLKRIQNLGSANLHSLTVFFFSEFFDLGENLIFGELSRVDDYGVFGGFQRGGSAGAVAVIAVAEVGGHGFGGRAFDLLLIETALLAHDRVCVEKNLEIGVGENLRADVAAFHHYSALSSHILLAGDHPFTHCGVYRDARGGFRDVALANSGGDIFSIEQDAIAAD